MMVSGRVSNSSTGPVNARHWTVTAARRKIPQGRLASRLAGDDLNEFVRSNSVMNIRALVKLLVIMFTD